MKLKNNLRTMELPRVQKHDNLHGCEDADSGMFLIIRLSDLKVMKILTQALILALFIMVLHGISSNFSKSSGKNDRLSDKKLVNEEALDLKSFQLVLGDLANQGILTTIDKSLIVSNDIRNHNHNNGKREVISPSDKEGQSKVADETFDFSFTNCLDFEEVRGFVDRTLKVGGMVVVQLSQEPSALAFDAPSNYQTVYFRRFDDTFIAMRKISTTTNSYTKTTTMTSTKNPPTHRKLLEFLSEEKKAVLKNLEDVLLEPPRSASGKSRAYLRKTKFLPDLLNDSLDGYSRRVYIDVGGGHGSTRWFEQNYPTRNKDFDMYRIDTVPEAEVESDDAWEGPPTQMGISDWLWRNVKAEEYVVMKAEAEVVEEMLKSKAIVLVDELFLDCKPRGKGGNSKRAYWECLALYGRLRDFGVAVHQWWG